MMGNNESSWSIQEEQEGILPLFLDESGEKIDIDAYVDSCYNLFGNDVCGNSTNKLINRNRTQINVRGVQGLWYLPK